MPRAAAIGRPLELEDAEDGLVAARVQLREALDRAAVGQRRRRSAVAAAVAVEEGGQGLLAQSADEFPETFFDLMHRPALAQRGLEQFEEFGDELFEQFFLEERQRFCNAHGRASCGFCC